MRSLRTKIGATYLLLVAVTVGVATFAAQSFTILSEDLRRLLDEDYRTVASAEGMAKALERQEGARIAWGTGDLDAALADFDEQGDQFRAWFNEADAVRSGEGLLDSIETTHDRYEAAAGRLYGALAAAETTRARPFERETAALAGGLRTLTFRVLDRTWAHMGAARARANADAERRSGLVLATALGALGLSLLLAGYLARTILGPIERLTDSVVALRQGRFRQTVPVRSNDELAELGREFNRMTERLAAFEAMGVQQLVAEKRKSETLVATMPSPVVVTGEDGRVLLLNEAARDLLGAPEGAWLDRPLGEVVPDATLRRVLAAPVPAPPEASGDGVAADEPETDEGEVVALESDGEPHHYRVRRRAVESGAGRLTVALLEDVTHFKRLDRLKTDFLAAVSHELRTPLMSMGMAVDLLRQDGAGLSDLQRDLLESVKDDNERLGRLVQGLLALARVESGTYRPPREPVRLAAVVEEGLGPLRLPYLEQGVALDVDVPESLPLVLGDAHHLGWVVTNLAGNALRYTPEGGRVTVTADADAHGVHLHVADTGTGVPPEALDAIFGAFVQVKAPGQATPGSLGLGLALARRVVEAHGGRIWAESVQAGPGDDPGGPSGSTFHVALPFDPDAVPAAARA